MSYQVSKCYFEIIFEHGDWVLGSRFEVLAWSHELYTQTDLSIYFSLIQFDFIYT